MLYDARIFHSRIRHACPEIAFRCGFVLFSCLTDWFSRCCCGLTRATGATSAGHLCTGTPLRKEDVHDVSLRCAEVLQTRASFGGSEAANMEEAPLNLELSLEGCGGASTAEQAGNLEMPKTQEHMWCGLPRTAQARCPCQRKCWRASICSRGRKVNVTRIEKERLRL